MRIVLDTNILVRAHAKARGPAREVLQLIADCPQHILLLSPFLLQELERVFDYERVRSATRLTDEEVAEYLSYLQAKQI
jgi:predicted nucleic acid-binding protein